MNALRKIQLDCRHATALIEKRQFTPLTRKEKWHLYFHLAGCSICRLFKRQSGWINRMLRHLGHSPSPIRLDDRFKQELQQKIDQSLPSGMK